MAALSKVSIENYRGFYEAGEIELAVPDGDAGSGLTVLVGPNNSGKSTVINAIRLVVGGPRQVDLEHRHPDSTLKISLTNDQGQTKTLSNPDLGAVTILTGDQNSFPTRAHLRVVPSRRAWNPYTGNQRMQADQYWSNRLESDDQDGYLVSRLADFTPEGRADFNRLLKELLPQLNSWKIELSRGSTFLLYETESGAKHAADLFGEGMISLFRLALALYDSVVGNIVVVDEPELSLHRQAQKALAAVLSRFSSDRQILVTTHSPYFVSWSDLSNGARIYRLSQKREGVIVGTLATSTIQDLEGLVNDWQKPDLLDAVSREVFFADGVVFFEGQEDVALVQRFTVEQNLSPVEAFGYGAGGFGNIKIFLQMAEDLNIQAAAVYDGQHADDKIEAEEEFPDAMIELLPTPDIRDKPARDEHGNETEEIEKVGIFDRSGVIKAEYKDYLRGLIERLRASFRKA